MTNSEVRAKFDEFFPMLEAVTKKSKREFFDRRKLADLKDYVKADGRYEWEDFKRAQTGRKGKVSDAAFTNFRNVQNGWLSVSKAGDGNTL